VKAEVSSPGRTLVVTPSRCTACRTCELACAFYHPVRGLPGLSRITAHRMGEDDGIPLVCFQCEEAACAAVCPVQAIRRNVATGALELDPDRCLGCRLCTVACPFGQIRFDAKSGLPYKCDLCGGNPACAAFCPTQALVYEEDGGA